MHIVWLMLTLIWIRSIHYMALSKSVIIGNNSGSLLFSENTSTLLAEQILSLPTFKNTKISFFCLDTILTFTHSTTKPYVRTQSGH